MSKKYILFDLDGTVIDSREGIMASLKHALLKMGIEENDYDTLKKYIGPPLDESFMNFHGFNHEDALKAVSAYRERYNEKGVYESKLFPRLPELLKALKDKGYTVALATCKPEIYIPVIFKHFDLYQYFDYEVGSELEGGVRRHKNQVIEEVFARIIEREGLSKEDIPSLKSRAIMVGDRKDDILGAKKAGIESIGVRYGFAEPMELEEAGADYIVDGVMDILTQIEAL